MHVYCETGMVSLVHVYTFSVSVAEHHFLPLVSLDLFVTELSVTMAVDMLGNIVWICLFAPGLSPDVLMRPASVKKI